MDAVYEAATLKSCILRLDFLDDLFSKRTHFSTARYRHVFIAFIAVTEK